MVRFVRLSIVAAVALTYALVGCDSGPKNPPRKFEDVKKGAHDHDHDHEGHDHDHKHEGTKPAGTAEAKPEVKPTAEATPAGTAEVKPEPKPEVKEEPKDKAEAK